jgi:hypothetical protein
MPLTSPLASILQSIPSVPRGAPLGGAAPGVPGAAPPGAGAAPGSPGGGPGGVPDEIFRQVLNQRLSQSGGADPSFVVTQLKQMMTGAAALLPKVAFRIPGVDKHLTRVYAALQAALTEAEKFQSNQAAGQPINFQAANVGPTSGAPAGMPA